MFKPTFRHKTNGSNGSHCPSLLETDDEHIVIGRLLSPAELDAVQAAAEPHMSGIGPGECAVALPRDVLDRLTAERQ